MTTQKQALLELADWMERHGVSAMSGGSEQYNCREWFYIYIGKGSIDFYKDCITPDDLREKAEGLAK